MPGGGGYGNRAAGPDRFLAVRRIRAFGQYGDDLPFAALGGAEVLHKTQTPYGVTAVVRRESVSGGAELSPVGIEELFVMMVKEMD